MKTLFAPLTLLMKGLVLAYRYTLGPYVGHGCRFRPTCSEYALDALTVHGPLKGGWLILHRLARCNPWGGHGFDPVPCAHRRDGHTATSGSVEHPGSGR